MERAKEKLRLKIDKVHVHSCAPAYSGMLSLSPKKPDIKEVVQLFLIHSTEKRAGETFCFNSESSMRKMWV